MEEGIRVLYVGPGESDVAARLREEAPDLGVATADSGTEAVDALAEERVDCVVSEHAADGVDGLALLDRVRDADPAVPFVLYARDGSETVASRAISAGVTDYVPAGDAGVDDLAAAVVDEAEHYRAEQDVAMLNDLARSVYERITDAFFALDREWQFTYVNQEAEGLLDAKAEDLLGEGIWETFPEAIGSTFYTEYHRALATQEAVAFEDRHPSLDRRFEVRAFPSEDGLSVHFREVGGESAPRDDHLRELTNVLTYDLAESVRNARSALEEAREESDAPALEDVERALDRMDDLISHSARLASER